MTRHNKKRREVQDALDSNALERRARRREIAQRWKESDESERAAMWGRYLDGELFDGPEPDGWVTFCWKVATREFRESRESGSENTEGSAL